MTPSLFSVLLHSMDSPVQEIHGPVGVHPEEGHENEQKDGTSYL